jgi:hypothetical protein
MFNLYLFSGWDIQIGSQEHMLQGETNDIRDLKKS